MKKRFYLLLMMLVMSTISCTTMRWKRKYVTENITKALETYSVGKSAEIKIPPELSGKSVRLSSKKQLKRNIKIIEKTFALIPDSVSNNSNNQIDSFYLNRNKMNYIKMHNLKTTGMKFLD